MGKDTELNFQRRGDAVIAKLCEAETKLILIRTYVLSLPTCPACRSRTSSETAASTTASRITSVKTADVSLCKIRKKIIDEATEHLMDKRLLEKLSLVLSATFGRLMKPCYSASDIGQSAKAAVKFITSSGFSGTLRQRVSKLVRKTLFFSKSSKIALAQSSISFIATTHPCSFRTTDTFISSTFLNSNLVEIISGNASQV